MAGSDTRIGAPSEWRLPDDHAGFMAGVFEDLARKPPYDRVLDLARLAPELKARGLPADLHDQLDLSNEGLAKTRAVLASAKPGATVWEMGLVPQKSRAWRPPIVPPLSEQQLQELDKTDSMNGFPPGQSRRQFKQEGGGPGVRSGAGAMGRAQVMPDRLKGLNKDRQKQRLGPLDPDDDDDAIIIQRELMGQLMKRFHDPGAAIAAYNAGPNPKRWPNRETKGYFGPIMQKPYPPGFESRFIK